jgi:tRNA (adenine37-N6)-methyltransferase
MSDPITVTPIGVVRRAHGTLRGRLGRRNRHDRPRPAELEPDAVLGLEGFSHVEVVFRFHLAVSTRRGAFHPLTVRGLDALDGSPVLDVKAYIDEMSPRGEVREPEWTRDLMRKYY